MKDDFLVQDYYNFVNIPGEYDLKNCLLSKRTVWEGLVSPVVLHVRNAYKYDSKMEKRHIHSGRCLCVSARAQSGHYPFLSTDLLNRHFIGHKYSTYSQDRSRKSPESQHGTCKSMEPFYGWTYLQCHRSYSGCAQPLIQDDHW